MISVCIATYNGEKYIKEQLNSILCQLSETDEVIVSDDSSTDSTLEIIKNFNDDRIKILPNNTFRNPVFNFENALKHAKGDLIFLSDQDDIWKDNRVSEMMSAMEQNNTLLLSSLFVCFENNLNTLTPQYNNYFETNTSTRYLKNIGNIIIGKRIYFGCTMLIKRELLSVALPVPKYVDCHDLWIALAANICRSNYHLNEPTLYRRIHENNASLKQRSLIKKIRTRFSHIVSIFTLYFREKQNRML